MSGTSGVLVASPSSIKLDVPRFVDLRSGKSNSSCSMILNELISIRLGVAC